MKKFALILLMLFSVTAQATESTFAIEVRYLGYEGENLKVTTITDLHTGCAANDDTNTFIIKPSALQRSIGGILMSAHQNKKFAAMLYNRDTCNELTGVDVVGASIAKEVASPAKTYGLISKAFLASGATYLNTTTTSQRLIFTGTETGNNASRCDYRFDMNDGHGTRGTQYLQQNGSCNINQMGVDIPAGGWFKYRDIVSAGSKAEYSIFGVIPQGE